tara:strand:+ start:31791 stop:32621 length:831 start_codon:yes stop_codon:yes gene_type:complete
MRTTIPNPVLAATADLLAAINTHTELESLFLSADVSIEAAPPPKLKKALIWLRCINENKAIENPLVVLGKLLQTAMERCNYQLYGGSLALKERLIDALADNHLRYQEGGHVVSSNNQSSVTKTLENMIKTLDYSSINDEFDRAAKKIESEPKEAVSAAGNILEATCKIYIEDEGIDYPAKKDLTTLWKTVRGHMGFKPGDDMDNDLKKILTGLFSLVSGVAALRTHVSSAHAAGKHGYRVDARHARLAVHAAHTATLYLLETWEKNKGRNGVLALF